jgi:GT2 family glycosyltransferase
MNTHSFPTPPVISVVIVNYNVKDLLVSCLASLEASLRGIPSEIIVVDNDSTDGSIDYAEPMFPGVHFTRLTDNLGFGKANNIGFDMALAHGAEFILCLNPDTLISEDSMSVVLEYMRSHSDVGLTGCKLLNADGTFQLACRRGFPTPWASFCKVFGLQALFPNSPRFAQYNQTFRSEDETYAVDAVMGAFMFIRREALEAVRGFDEEFFMYGEDLDLCFRIQAAGWVIMYLHTTSIIHYKGESTRRSAINEVKHFYEAMEIFARKHYGSSWLFLAFLRLGITVRSVLAYLSLYRWEAGFAVSDVLSLNLAMLVGTYVWKGRFFAFPEYAYPTVFVVISLVTLLSMIAAGEYSPYSKPSIRRAFSGLMISFFALSALTYFFKSYAFSRGVLLLTIGIGIVLATCTRVLARLFEQIVGGESEKRIAFVGDNAATQHLVAQLDAPSAASVGKRSRASIVGIITTEHEASAVSTSQTNISSIIPIIGNISYLRKIIEQYKIQEVIITDTAMPRAEIVRNIIAAAQTAASERATFRFAQEYDDVIAGRIVEKYVGGAQPVVQYNLAEWKYRLFKRTFDILSALFVLTIGLPVVILNHAIQKNIRKNVRYHNYLRDFIEVLRGRKSVIGVYPIGTRLPAVGKVGLTGLAHVHSPENLSLQALQSLNEFYVKHYSIWLDVDILVTLFFRLRRYEQRS